MQDIKEVVEGLAKDPEVLAAMKDGKLSKTEAKKIVSEKFPSLSGDKVDAVMNALGDEDGISLDALKKVTEGGGMSKVFDAVKHLF